MRNSSILLATILTLLLNSCKNDLNIIAPYKEIPLVYAILTPQLDMQMIRINKVFLGQGDANQMAQVPDSVNYKPGELTVKLERFFNGAKVAAASTPTGNVMDVYFRDTLIQTEPGAFTTTQRVYVCNEKLFTYGEYKLTIKNNRTGNEYKATATSLDSVPLSYLPPMAAPFYGDPALQNPWEPPSSWVDYSNTNTSTPYIVRTKAAPGAYLHDLTIRIHYYDSLATGRVNRFLDYSFNPKLPKEMQPLSSNMYFNFSFTGNSLFQELGNMLKERGNPAGVLGRMAYRVDFICYAAKEDYYEYLQYSAPSLTFAQEKIIFSNFEKRAALGIFSFRSRCMIKKAMDIRFIDAFASNKHTCRYLFWESDFDRPGCP